MPTKIELTLEQSQQGVSNDVLVSIKGVEELKRNVWIKGENKAALQTLLGSYALSWKPCQGDSLNLPDHRYGLYWCISVYGYDGLHMLPVAPPSPDYIPSPEEPQTPPAPQDEDEHELMFIQPHDPNFEHPLPPIVLPTAESPGYVAESDPEEDPEEYEEDETEDGPVGHPMDGGDDGDDDDGNSSGYDADDEDEDEGDGEKEEEEHLAPADFAVVIPIDELASPPEGTNPIIPPPSTNTATTGSRITIRPQTSISLPPEAEPPRKRLCLSTLGSRYEVGESSTRGRRVDYGFADAVEAEMRHRGIGEVGYRVRDTRDGTTTLEKVNTRVTELAELHEHDTQDLYAPLEDDQDGDSMDRGGGGLYCPRGLGSFGRVKPDRLRETDRVRQSQIVETLRVMRDMRREMGDMQAELLALRGQPRRARQSRGDVRVPNHQDAPRDADSHI
nr:hypothetical protein [Tanacetum cinerariifolium]